MKDEKQTSEIKLGNVILLCFCLCVVHRFISQFVFHSLSLSPTLCIFPSIFDVPMSVSIRVWCISPSPYFEFDCFNCSEMFSLVISPNLTHSIISSYRNLFLILFQSLSLSLNLWFPSCFWSLFSSLSLSLFLLFLDLTHLPHQQPFLSLQCLYPTYAVPPQHIAFVPFQRNTRIAHHMRSHTTCGDQLGVWESGQLKYQPDVLGHTRICVNHPICVATTFKTQQFLVCYLYSVPIVSCSIHLYSITLVYSPPFSCLRASL